MAESRKAASGAPLGTPKVHGPEVGSTGGDWRTGVALPLWILAILALLWGAAVARTVLLPIVVASILHACFSPFVRLLARKGVGRPVGALIVMGSLAMLLVGSVSYLAQPAERWAEELPHTFYQLREKIGSVRGSVEGAIVVSEKVEELTEMAAGESESAAVKVIVQDETTLLEDLLSQTWRVGGGLLITLALLFLMLAHEGELLQNLMGLLSKNRDKKNARKIVVGFQREVSSYFVHISLINVALGVVLGLSLWGLGVPNPALWGALAAVLNFVPYIGAIVGIGVVAVVSLVTFDDIEAAWVPPAVYLVLTTIEGGLVTPAIMGKRLTLRPAFVLMWLMLWSALWGIPGALLATPLLVAFKILSDHLEAFRPVGQLFATVNSAVAKETSDTAPPVPRTSVSPH